MKSAGWAEFSLYHESELRISFFGHIAFHITRLAEPSDVILTCPHLAFADWLVNT